MTPNSLLTKPVLPALVRRTGTVARPALNPVVAVAKAGPLARIPQAA